MSFVQHRDAPPCGCPPYASSILVPREAGPAQLSIGAVELSDGDHGRWHSGPYCVPGAPCEHRVRHGFTHMIRAPGDPERQTREARRARLGPGSTTEAMRSRKTRSPDAALAEVLELLSDGEPRTLNRIGVELWDQTADVVDDRIWWAIVDAVIEGQLEHCSRAPILLRRRAA